MVKTFSFNSLKFIKRCAATIKPLRETTLKTVQEIRDEQIEIDIKAVELYDITLKITSFLCMNNRMGKVQMLTKIDKLRMFFGYDGAKNNYIPASNYVQNFMKARDPLIKFYYDFGVFKVVYMKYLERKIKDKENRKKREADKQRKKQLANALK